MAGSNARPPKPDSLTGITGDRKRIRPRRLRCFRPATETQRELDAERLAAERRRSPKPKRKEPRQ